MGGFSSSRDDQRRALWPALVGCCLLVLCSGCGDSETSVELMDVSGAVFFEGRPASGALVVFHPLGDDGNQLRPRGYVRDDGSFRLTTFSLDDGIPVGRYVVTISWREGDDDDEPGELLVPMRYMSPSTSGLEAEIRAGSNQLEPFQLKR